LFPPDASLLEIQTGFGKLVGHRFRAPDVYGGDPYYAEAISAAFTASGRDWAVEVVLPQQRRVDMLAIVLEFLRTLRSA
jgi:hypothetical protein